MKKLGAVLLNKQLLNTAKLLVLAHALLLVLVVTRLASTAARLVTCLVNAPSLVKVEVIVVVAVAVLVVDSVVVIVPASTVAKPVT